MYILTNGMGCLYRQVAISSQFNFGIPDKRGTILGFMKYILVCCEKSSPLSTPTLPGEERGGIKSFSTEVKAQHFGIILDE